MNFLLKVMNFVLKMVDFQADCDEKILVTDVRDYFNMHRCIDADVLFERLDDDENGTLDKDEFIAFAMRMSRGEVADFWAGL